MCYNKVVRDKTKILIIFIELLIKVNQSVNVVQNELLKVGDSLLLVVNVFEYMDDFCLKVLMEAG